VDRHTYAAAKRRRRIQDHGATVFEDFCRALFPGSRRYWKHYVNNVNSEVDRVFDGEPLRRVFAQVDVRYSNSLLEAWWWSLRHQGRYLNPLGTIGLADDAPVPAAGRMPAAHPG